MKKFVGLLVAILMVLALSSVAFAGTDFTLEFARDFDAEETSGYSEIVTTLNPAPFNFTLTWNHNFLPVVGNTVKLESGLKLSFIELGYVKELTIKDPGTFTASIFKGPFTIGYEKELTIDDPGVGTIDLVIGLISLGYEYEFADDKSGKITATYSKSF